MFGLQKITLLQFKNYRWASYSFNERVIGICGNNGLGKTNLLDAIHYLCFCKSYFSKSDSNNVCIGHQGFRIEGLLHKDENNHKLVCILRETGKKEFLLDDEAYSKFSHHIGKYPCVMIAPDDISLITDGSEERRKFLDTIISQLDETYLQHLITYSKILQQRNSLLKQFAESGTRNMALLDIFNSQLKEPCLYIFEKRRSFLEEFIPLVQQFYSRIAGKEEKCGLVYESQLNNRGYDELMEMLKEKDLMLQRTNAGTHKDDIDFILNDHSFKSIASQGQRKSLLFALKLAEFEILKQQKGFPPILLLDDVFEKLDDHRMHNLMHYVCKENEGQVFITDTHRERLKKALDELNQPIQILELMEN
jgi:DNA replication and repair protein RecF